MNNITSSSLTKLYYEIIGLLTFEEFHLLELKEHLEVCISRCRSLSLVRISYRGTFMEDHLKFLKSHRKSTTMETGLLHCFFKPKSWIYSLLVFHDNTSTLQGNDVDVMNMNMYVFHIQSINLIINVNCWQYKIWGDKGTLRKNKLPNNSQDTVFHYSKFLKSALTKYVRDMCHCATMNFFCTTMKLAGLQLKFHYHYQCQHGSCEHWALLSKHCDHWHLIPASK